MRNPLVTIVIIFFTFLLLSQLLLEYYVHLTDLTRDSKYSKKNFPNFITSNKIFPEDKEIYIKE